MQAVEAALELLSAVFELDEAFVEEQQRRRLPVATLDALLMANPLWVLHLIQYVRFEANTRIQVSAIKIAGHLAARDSRFVHILLQFPSELRHLVYDYTLCLNASLFGGADAESEAESGGGAGTGVESCAALIMQLLQDNAEKEFPNLTQVLLGYTVTGVRCLALALIRYSCVFSEP